MHRAAALVALATLAILAVTHAEDVLDLANGDELTAAIENNDRLVVKFYAPWCGHCKSLAPEYEKAASLLKEQGSTVVLAKIDADANRDVAAAYDVQGYPTLKMFNKGSSSEFGGGRDADSIVNYASRAFGPKLQELQTSEQIAESVKSQVTVVAVIEDGNEDQRAVLNQVAERRFDTCAFFIAKDTQVSCPSKPCLVVHRAFENEETELKFSSEFNYESLDLFIRDAAEKQFGILTPSANQLIHGLQHSERPKLIFFFNKDDSNAEQAFEDAYKALPSSVRQKVYYAGIHADEFSGAVRYFGMEDGPFPTALGREQRKAKGKCSSSHETTNAYDFPWTADTFSKETIVQWVNDVVDGKIEGSIKSENRPDDATEDGVAVLTAKNFEKLACGGARDYFVEIYAPWCGFCKKLAPVWNRLALSAAKNDNLVIAKFDGVANHVPPGIAITGFPTLLFFPAGADDYIAFDGSDRSLSGLQAFIKKHATGSVTFEAVASTSLPIPEAVQQAVPVAVLDTLEQLDSIEVASGFTALHLSAFALVAMLIIGLVACCGAKASVPASASKKKEDAKKESNKPAKNEQNADSTEQEQTDE